MILTLDHALKEIAATRIAAGLKRKSISKCSKWTEAYRIMGMPFPGNWSFMHHPWSREMHDCENELVIGQKAAQMAYTETGINKIFFNIDVRGLSAMYVLPASKPDATDFSTSRFDPALEASPHLRNMFSDVRNIGHKRAGSANLYIRGSRSRSQLKSVGTAIMVFNEVDEMVQKNISLGEERTSGQLEDTVQICMWSTPTIAKYGINSYFLESTQDHYVFQCPHCSRFTTLEEECLVITSDNVHDPEIKKSHLICKECKAILNHETKVEWLKDRPAGGTAHWIPTYANRISRGFQINQLYSMVVPPYKIGIKKMKGESDPTEEQEYHNSKMGSTHTVKGAQINDEHIDACMGEFKKYNRMTQQGLVTMGVDVGKWLHIEIDQWFFKKGGVPSHDINLMAYSRLLYEGKVEHFEDLDKFMKAFLVSYCIIDAHPERRKATEFAQRFWGYVRLCFYGNAIAGKSIHLGSEEEHTITVDRTSWLDLSLGRVKREAISFPVDLSLEYKDHIKAPVRVYRKDKDGNAVGMYVTGSEDDHFAHARNYAELALPLAASLMTSQDIKDVV